MQSIECSVGGMCQITELTLPMDKMSGTRKPFAFVAFESAQAVEQLCTVEKHSVGGKMVRCHFTSTQL